MLQSMLDEPYILISEWTKKTGGQVPKETGKLHSSAPGAYQVPAQRLHRRRDLQPVHLEARPLPRHRECQLEVYQGLWMYSRFGLKYGNKSLNDDDKTVEDLEVRVDSTLTWTSALSGQGKRARVQVFVSKEVEIEGLTAAIEMQHLDLRGHNTPLIGEILQKVVRLEQMTADVAMSQVSMDDLARLVTFSAPMNKTYTYEAVAKILMPQEHANLNKLRRFLDMSEPMMLNTVKLLLGRRSMVTNDN